MCGLTRQVTGRAKRPAGQHAAVHGSAGTLRPTQFTSKLLLKGRIAFRADRVIWLGLKPIRLRLTATPRHEGSSYDSEGLQLLRRRAGAIQRKRYLDARAPTLGCADPCVSPIMAGNLPYEGKAKSYSCVVPRRIRALGTVEWLKHPFGFIFGNTRAVVFDRK